MRQVFTTGRLEAGGQARIEGADYLHLSVSLRLRPGEALLLVDPQGGRFQAKVESLDRQSLSARVEAALPSQPPLVPLSLGLCLPSADAFDAALDAAVQLGASSITPLESERSQRSAKDRGARWARIARESCCQCLRAALPEITAPKDLAAFLKDPGPGRRLAALPSARPLDGAGLEGPACLLVGPEGGFSPAEESAIREAGWDAISLGPRVLRVPVAVAAGLALIQKFREGSQA